MPVTITNIGDTLVVSLIDTDLESLQDLMRVKLVEADFVGKFTRYQILRYTGGRVVSINNFANPLMLKAMSTSKGQLDLTYRYGSTNDYQTIDNLANDWTGLAMELLGSPGPSLYYQWQEDSFTSAQVAAYDTSGVWPPSYWPINRYPSDLCFSFWLTIPGASQRIWVNEACVARVRGTAKGDLNFHQCGVYTYNGGMIPYGNFFYGAINTQPNKRELHMSRFALFVDTNPDLGTEFANSNPNILNRDGSQASYVSWKKLKEKCYYTPQRGLFKLNAEVKLQGGHFYNFSMKYRDGGVRGGIIDGGWDSGHWRPDTSKIAGPNLAASWDTLYTNNVYNQPYMNKPDSPNPDLVGLWESSGITVEFFYGRQTAYVTDSASSEFSNVP